LNSKLGSASATCDLIV